MTAIVFGALTLIIGTALGGAIAFRATSDVYDEELDKVSAESYGYRRELIKAQKNIEDLTAIIEAMRPIHCQPPRKIVEIEWDDVEFPNSEAHHG